MEYSPSSYRRVLFLLCPTGKYCREDRCQSFFDPKLVPSMRPPLEECEAAGAVRDAGGLAKIIDAPALELSESEVLMETHKFQPDLIILSVTFGSLVADLRWASLLKSQYPHVPIGLRGAPCYVWAEKIVEENPTVDFCLRGDYELVIRDLLQGGIGEARGVVSRVESGKRENTIAPFAEDLDDLPLPDRSSLDSHRYRVRVIGARQATVRVQRGCPFPCTYCLVHTVSGKEARHRSPLHIVREVQSLFSEGIRFIYFRADTFSLKKSWALELSEALAKHCPGLQWVSTTRAECIDDELMMSFRRSGCYGLSFGLDVASKEIAKRVRKPLNVDAARDAMRLCDKHGILSLAYIMIGFLWDTRETLEESCDFVRSIRPDLLTIHFAHPYPGTAYYDAVRRAGAKVVSLHAQAEPAIEGEQLSASVVRDYGLRMLRIHYRRPAVLFSLGSKLMRIGCSSLRLSRADIFSPKSTGKSSCPSDSYMTSA